MRLSSRWGSLAVTTAETRNGASIPSIEAPLEVNGSGPPKAVSRGSVLYHAAQALCRLTRTISRACHGRTVTLSIEEGVVRAVIFKGREVVCWGISGLHEGTDHRGEESAPSDGDQAQSLRLFLKQLGVGRGRVIIDLPFYTTLVRHLQLPRMGKRYLGQVVESEVLETIPFPRDEVDIAWHRREKGAHQDVIAMAVPKAVVDHQAALLKEAGIRPAAIYSRAASLALATGSSDAIVVHLWPTRASIVLAREGVPRVVHQVELPEGTADECAQAETLAKGVELAVSHYHALDQDHGDTALPVVVISQASAGKLTRGLESLLHRDVLTFAPQLVYPEHFDPGEYGSNLAMAVADRARGPIRKGRARGGSCVNLLPRRHLPRTVPVPFVAVAMALLLIAIAAFNVTDKVGAAELEASTLSERLDTLEVRDRQHRLRVASERAVENRIQAASDTRLALESHLADLDSATEAVLRRVNAIGHDSLPPNTHVSTLSLQGKRFSIRGSAPTYEDVFQYAMGLRQSGDFSDVLILRMDSSGSTGSPSASQGAAGGRVNFHIEASGASVQGTGPAHEG